MAAGEGPAHTAHVLLLLLRALGSGTLCSAPAGSQCPHLSAPQPLPAGLSFPALPPKGTCQGSRKQCFPVEEPSYKAWSSDTYGLGSWWSQEGIFLLRNGLQSSPAFSPSTALLVAIRGERVGQRKMDLMWALGKSYSIS